MATIIDIARACGVSPATVSYALNGKGHVSDEMRAFIRKVAGDMNYVPSQAARNLQKGRSNVIAVMIADLTSFYNSQVLEHLEREIRERHLQVIVACSSNEKQSEVELFRRMVAQAPLGVVWFPSVGATEETLAQIDRIASDNRIPTLAVYKDRGGGRYLKYLEWDLCDAVRRITGRLLDAGQTDVRFFGPQSGGLYLEMKQKGYLDAFAERGLCAPRLISDMDETYCAAKDYMTAYLEEGKKLPQSIVAVNDIAGYGILRALEEYGIRVPEQVSIVGVDGIRFDYADARMTTVTPDLALLAKQGVEMLCRFNEDAERVYRCENRILIGTTSV